MKLYSKIKFFLQLKILLIRTFISSDFTKMEHLLISLYLFKNF